MFVRRFNYDDLATSLGTLLEAEAQHTAEPQQQEVQFAGKILI